MDRVVRAREPEAFARYPKDVTRSIPLSQLRLADFEQAVPWRIFRSYQGQKHFRVAIGHRR
jgi:hypothetical protein